MKNKNSLTAKKFISQIADKLVVGDVFHYCPEDLDKKHYDIGIIIDIEKRHRDSNPAGENIYHVAWCSGASSRTEYTDYALYTKLILNPVFKLIKCP
jgi:hypothetical protein